MNPMTTHHNCLNCSEITRPIRKGVLFNCNCCHISLCSNEGGYVYEHGKSQSSMICSECYNNLMIDFTTWSHYIDKSSRCCSCYQRIQQREFEVLKSGISLLSQSIELFTVPNVPILICDYVMIKSE